MLKNASSLAIVGLDTAENGPSKVRQVTNRIDAIIGAEDREGHAAPMALRDLVGLVKTQAGWVYASYQHFEVDVNRLRLLDFHDPGDDPTDADRNDDNATNDDHPYVKCEQKQDDDA